MRAGKIVLIVLGAVVALAGLGSLAGGGTLVWAHTTQRDAAGFYNTPTDHLATSTYALTAAVDFGTDASQGDLWVPVHPAGTVRVRAVSDHAQAVFIGIGPTSSVNTWLAGVAHVRVTSIAFGPFETVTHTVVGTRAPSVPGSQRFWVATASGQGRQSLVWPTERGQWSVVVMNAAATAGVAVDLSVGMRTGLLLPIGIGLGIFGLLLLAGAALLLYLGLRGRPNALPAPTEGALGAPLPAEPGDVGPATAYPVRLDGRLDPSTSRWLWLFKWVLVIPHVVVLAFLWVAAFVLTICAGVSILFTGRYPKGIFAFNVGVFRWTWRVTFYALGAFATDRYPPFSLRSDPTYPADFTVDYPERLSRGLVLVKWWLLAIPQYVVVAFFAGAWSANFNGVWRGVAGYGLIGVLALIAAVVLAATGRYPTSTFEFLMGMNRWCYRVLAYAALLRDEYPPFRLDAGGTDPGTVRPSGSPPRAPDRTGELVGAATSSA